MAINSTTFGRTELTGKDAQRFFEQFVRDTKPNQKAIEFAKSSKARISDIRKSLLSADL